MSPQKHEPAYHEACPLCGASWVRRQRIGRKAVYRAVCCAEGHRFRVERWGREREVAALGKRLADWR